jgi:hypothetical protein
VSINFSQFPTPTLPINEGDFVVGYQNPGTGGNLTLAQYTFAEIAEVIGAGSPSGPAGGDLSGNYPNPTVSAVHVTTGTIDNTIIGGTVPNAANFTNVNVSGNLTVSAVHVTTGTIDNTIIGGTVPNAANFTNVNVSGNFIPSSTNGVTGTVAGDNANAGSIGEYANVSTGFYSVPLDVATNIGALSLSAGDWDVWGSLTFGQFTNATVSYTVEAGLFTDTSAPFGPEGIIQSTMVSLGGDFTAALPLIPIRANLNAPFNVSLVASQTDSSSTGPASMIGYIYARRRR